MVRFAPTPANTWSPSTLGVHADDHLASTTDVAPPLHLSTTFSYPSDPSALITATERDGTLPVPFIYSREAAPNTARFEAILTSLLNAPAITYSSGLAALFAAYTLLKPRRAFISGGYHGAHDVLAIHSRLTGLEVHPLPSLAAAAAAEDGSQPLPGPGDVVHVETPVNPTGEARDLRRYAAVAHARGALVLVDATFAPPPLQDPFAAGADVVMHSGTKYIGGHSDMLCGVLATRRPDWLKTLWLDRMHMGNMMGSLESWLGVRSVRTLQLRIEAQSRGAERLVAWLAGAARADAVVKGVVERVQHASLQSEEELVWVREQMPGGFGPVFAVTMREERMARVLPSKLRLFHHATSLGGVESLCEWRAMSDPTVDRRLLRFSVGVEGWEDLRDDIMQAFEAIAEEQGKAA